MSVTSRPFASIDDLSRLKSLVTACMSSDMQDSFWHVGDLVWGMYQNTLFDPRQHVRLWENEAGELIGFAWREKHGTGMQAAPQHRHDSELLGQMVAWGEVCQREAVAQEGAEPTYTVSAFEDNFPLLNLLAQQGFQRDEFYMLHMRRDLSQPIPEAKLPEGWVVRAVGGEDEFEQRVNIHREVWHPSKVTLEAYRRMRGIAGYTPECDFVVVAPDGTFASYCICWLDPVSKIGEFEPVGTRAAFRGKGLGKALMLHTLRRLHAHSMQTAIVCCVGSNEPAWRLYESVGFQTYNRSFDYSKRL
ncbi:MAG TPA: N-acetyltransferase [Ktedonobacteraceae bacterium]|nr:N-acetyltransferase [Ktedonobacteraceae bacterium]